MRFTFWHKYKNEAHQMATVLLWEILQRASWVPRQVMWQMWLLDLVSLEEKDAEEWFSKSLNIYYEWKELGVLNLNGTK